MTMKCGTRNVETDICEKLTSNLIANFIRLFIVVVVSIHYQPVAERTNMTENNAGVEKQVYWKFWHFTTYKFSDL